jgi:hypothetical protein
MNQIGVARGGCQRPVGVEGQLSRARYGGARGGCQGPVGD